MNKIKSGIKGLDKILRGGIPEGRTILVSGKSGAGKTILGSQFIFEGLKNNENCVFVTLEELKDHLVNDLLEIGIDFKKYEKSGKLKIIGGPIGKITYFKEKTKATALDLIDEIVEVATLAKAKRIVLDSTNLFLGLFNEDDDMRRALAGLSFRLNTIGCTSIFTCEIKESSKDISWYGFEEFVVDGVISLYRVQCKSAFERGISIIKMRGCDHDKKICHFDISKKGAEAYPEQKLIYGF